jgi:serine phosphatase RsbU (regulator of sigma subunit)
VVLMVTDGVTDAVSSRYDQEGWLTETLRGCRYSNPQDVADYILSEAERLSEGLPKDDMTVLAARVWERV